MKTTPNYPTRTLLKLLLVPAFFLLFINCSENNSLEADTGLYSDEQAADAIASGVSQETGGATDQLSDLSALAGTDGLQKMVSGGLSLAKSNSDRIVSVDSSYDDTTGKWTISVNIERTIPQRNFSARFTRVYTVQYLKGGLFQKYYVSNGDTANTIKFNIVEGSGSIQSLRLKHKLNSLSAAWVATNANQKVMAVAGTYSRAATDTFNTRRTEATIDYILSFNFAGINIPANDSDAVPALIAGTMTGDFIADMSLTRGDQTSERNVDQSFSVAFASQVFTLVINGGNYTANTITGEVDN